LQIHSLTKAKDDAGRVRAISRLLKGIERSSHMVEQLLALARNEPFSQPFRPQLVLLTEIVRQAVDEVEPLAMSKGIAVEIEQSDDLHVWGESEALQISVRNLLDNAIRYIPENGLIRIACEAREEGVVLRVEDTGSGIPLSDRARVFDRFYRVPGTEQTGTGLGLAIVKAIADRHGADIALKDSRIGGLAVQIIFPGAKAVVPREPESEESIS
ncbi:MAG: sensor histidine kinase, partial [Burkholderiaceae bacterium]